MPNLSALANIPFYGAYVAKKQLNEQQPLEDIKEASALLGLKNAIQEQKEQQELKSVLAGAGDVEAAMQAALRAGNANVAAKLSPLVEARRKAMAAPELKAAPTRQRYDGTSIIQEEMQPDGTWREIGRGPRFAPPAPDKPEKPQVFPVITTPEGVFERRPEGLVRLTVPGTNQPLTSKPPAAEQGLTPENAGKVAMAQQSVQAIDTAKKIIFDQNGNLNRGIVGAINLPIVAGLPMNSNARIARSALRNAIEAKLRLETGAAATESEVDRTLARFMPTPADTNESAKFKLDELQKFFNSSLSMTKGIPSKPTATSAPKVVDFGELK